VSAEQAALEQGLALHDELIGRVDPKTLAILERRRKTAVIRRRGWLIRRLLLLADVIGLTAAFAIVEALYPGQRSVGHVRLHTEILLFMLTLPLWVVVAKLYGLYDHDEERTDHTTADDLVGVLHLVTIGTWLLFIGGWATGLATPTPPKLITSWLLAIGLITVARLTARAYARRSIVYLQNTVIVGAGEVGQLVARKFLHHPEYGINLVGFVDSDPIDRVGELEHMCVLGRPESLPGIVRLLDVERVVIAFPRDSHAKTLALIRSLKDLDVQVDIVPRLFEIVGSNIGMHTVEGLPLFGLPPVRLSRSSLLLKRVMDLVL
jgi:FlaA1/EpsC-like NDP-sugar epimerase